MIAIFYKRTLILYPPGLKIGVWNLIFQSVRFSKLLLSIIKVCLLIKCMIPCCSQWIITCILESTYIMISRTFSGLTKNLLTINMQLPRLHVEKHTKSFSIFRSTVLVSKLSQLLKNFPTYNKQTGICNKYYKNLMTDKSVILWSKVFSWQKLLYILHWP